jgi:alkylation response protein AidB-like acyl-CoA dehydrogenase
MAEFLRDRDMTFLLYEVLDTMQVLERPRYQDHDRATLDETLRSARIVAEKFMLNHYQKADANEPEMVDGAVVSIPETKQAWRAICDGGFMDSTASFDDGGLQMPEVISRAIMTYFFAANNCTSAIPLLTQGVINLIRSFADDDYKKLWIPQLSSGVTTGTMALTEPDQGSALGDITTRAEPQDDGTWRIFGRKIFISAGDTDVSDNIVHMTLAKTAGAAAGAKGISLFLVPKFLPNEDGSPGRRNDVYLSSVLHKMGQRNSPSTMLNFGENEGAVGWLVGGEGNGLANMFQMMNEARIGVGLVSAAIANRGFLYSLDYARERPQGRLPSNKNPNSPQIMICEHADVRRMLLLQKCYSEGAMALCLYAASLFEDAHTHPDANARDKASLLLDLLTPVVKTWSAKYGCVSNELAIQVLGGAGYTREYPVEQLYRDQRINPIHEGVEAIHGLDILGRKVRVRNGAAFEALSDEIGKTIAQAKEHEGLLGLATELETYLQKLCDTTDVLLAQQSEDIDAALSNATVYLDVFGRITVAWIWLKQSIAAEKGQGVGDDVDFYAGKIAATRFYFEWELPQADHAFNLLIRPSLLPLNTPHTVL